MVAGLGVPMFRVFMVYLDFFLPRYPYDVPPSTESIHYSMSMYTLMCLSIGTPKNNKFSICSKWKIHYF